jgi:hypothetical protein
VTEQTFGYLAPRRITCAEDENGLFHDAVSR